jgi:uncharacterized metal-binding protein
MGDDELRIECARCEVPKGRRACDSPKGAAPRGCPTRHAREAVAAAVHRLDDPALREVARMASCQEAAGYVRSGGEAHPSLTRLEEVCGFARRIGAHRIGLAFCAGLLTEAAAVDRVLRAQGFEVLSVVCKVGKVPKEDLGLGEADKVRPGTFESMCHPLAQAELLNRAGTELNVLLGLCVGHDALFLRHATAWSTVLAAKDRVLGHNPLAAVYTSGSYYRRLLRRPDTP